MTRIEEYAIKKNSISEGYTSYLMGFCLAKINRAFQRHINQPEYIIDCYNS